MRNDLTDITLIVDRSGSMAGCLSDAQGGLDTLIKKQQEEKGECNLTIVEFDDHYNVVCNGVDIKTFKGYELIPRGSTALLDAVGKTINTIGERLHNTKEEDRPGCVIVAIITDGEENASREFTNDQIKQKIDTQTKQYNWQFMFLGADEFSTRQGIYMGIGAQNAVVYNKHNYVGACNMVSDKMSCARVATMCGNPVDMSFNDKDRKDIV